MINQKMTDRFLRYVKRNTRSDEASTTVPTTQSQVEFAGLLADEMREIGVENVHYLPSNGYVIGTIQATTDKAVRKIGLISHLDTADFNAEGVNPQLIENYDGKEITLGASAYSLDPKDFPNLNNYLGQTLITTDGTTLLGADDKAGIAEIMTAADYLLQHPEIEHGEIRIGFGPDEEIGVGADLFDVVDFDVDFAYTIDGGPLGELEYETFNAAGVTITIAGRNVHPGTAKNQMINALQLANDFHNRLPEAARPELTDGRQGFYHLASLTGTPEAAEMTYIIRDHDRTVFEEMKANLIAIADQLNASFDQVRLTATVKDQYYNMAEVIEKDMSIVTLAETAMKNLGITPKIEPVRGGTDGSKISFMGIPTPNIFAGGENMHGRFEFVSLETMQAAVDTIIEIVTLNAK
ncbi:MAG: peptidase T [Lactococcus sp.]|uniref:Peptidase T n=1 Tax=Pseudolactococcus piscium MKFS47 TaxID=297352 RepID=A0A0D6DZW5_9LACT|nr:MULTISPECIES: peptidase T [Lactococcus]MDN5403127.1 peptidase T [Lactococcus sp.]MDN5408730.1 peptidase T [Lactococcus sp.]MDN5411142.1 peptidase T [Lactococcus sp.]MDN5435412.1 peptidase T [Lactococcus sp.]MDN5461255.1 peptidase T [Lactococcus sp.]